MTSHLSVLLENSHSAFWYGFVVFLRVGSVVMVLPAFGEQTVPVRVKLAVGLCFTMIVAAAMPIENLPADREMTSFLPYLVAEPVNGLTLGLGFRLLVMALQMAGVIAAQALSLSQILGGAGVDPMPAVGQVLLVAGLALATMSGLHVQVAKALILSYNALPAGKLPLPSDLASWGLDQIARSMALAFSLAAPFLIVSVLYNLTLGVINRAMPQLMVTFIGAPAITLAGLILLFMLAPLMLAVWVKALQAFAANPFSAQL